MLFRSQMTTYGPCGGKHVADRGTAAWKNLRMYTMYHHTAHLEDIFPFFPPSPAPCHLRCFPHHLGNHQRKHSPSLLYSTYHGGEAVAWKTSPCIIFRSPLPVPTTSALATDRGRSGRQRSTPLHFVIAWRAFGSKTEKVSGRNHLG